MTARLTKGESSATARANVRSERASDQQSAGAGALADILVAVPTSEIVAATGCHRNTVLQWKKRGGSLPRPDQLPAIARAVGIPLDKVRTAYTADFRRRDEPPVKTKKRSG